MPSSRLTSLPFASLTPPNMRAALRLLASVQKGARFLEPGTPTGLTGLFTHASPRSTLLYLYSATLNQLKQFPESSVYRQSTEALTKHRMSIIENVKPAGLEEWQKRVQVIVDEYPGAFEKIPISTLSGTTEYNLVWKTRALEGMKTDEWDDEYVGNPELEGPRTPEERGPQFVRMQRDLVEEQSRIPRIEPEPSLSADQINDIEGKIGAGLIEEIIQVAEGEKELAATMMEHKV